MKKSILIVVFLIVTNYCLLSQERTFSLSFSGGYGWQLAEKEEYKMVNSYDQQRMMNFDANLSYYLTDQFSLGLGVGFAGYNNTNLVAFPAFIDLRYSFEKCPNLFT
ncbi:hypothetical protein AGMMS49982_12720 [Bacteroidia bacterium]|nr:hypothetical protein AGMMS49982_12720 [Bacteroidia bacterium]